MSKHKQKKRISRGISNADKEFNSRFAILKALSDGQWHRNMNLRKETKLSPFTLTKHLKQMTNIIEKKKDAINGKHAVLYKAKRETITFYKAYLNRKIFSKDSEKVLNDKKDPFIILDTIHHYNTLIFAELLTRIQQNKNITTEEIDFFAECFLWTNFKQWTSELIKASRKIISNLNLIELLVKEAQRQRDYHEHLYKTYKKRLQQGIRDVPSH